jgi:hypothetical protein
MVEKKCGTFCKENAINIIFKNPGKPLQRRQGWRMHVGLSLTAGGPTNLNKYTTPEANYLLFKYKCLTKYSTSTIFFALGVFNNDVVFFMFLRIILEHANTFLLI